MDFERPRRQEGRAGKPKVNSLSGYLKMAEVVLGPPAELLPNVKVVQELMRHASSQFTLQIDGQAQS